MGEGETCECGKKPKKKCCKSPGGVAMTTPPQPEGGEVSDANALVLCL